MPLQLADGGTASTDGGETTAASEGDAGLQLIPDAGEEDGVIDGGSCVDRDGDGFGVGCDGQDCDDGDNTCRLAGDACCLPGSCADSDGDLAGTGACPEGVDCNVSDASCFSPGDSCCVVGANFCGDIINCVNDCPDAQCSETCIESGTTAAQELYGALQDCLSVNGCYGVSAPFGACLVANCAMAAAACGQNN